MTRGGVRSGREHGNGNDLPVTHRSDTIRGAALPGAPVPVPAVAEARARRGVRRGFVFAFAASVAVHLALSAWPVDPPSAPDMPALLATITELPPPPKPAAVAAKAKPKPRRANPLPPPIAAPEPSPVAADEAPAPIEPTADAIAMGPEPPAVPVEVADAAPDPIPPEPAAKPLPPRIDLVYKGFLGTPWLPDRRCGLSLRALGRRVPDFDGR